MSELPENTITEPFIYRVIINGNITEQSVSDKNIKWVRGTERKTIRKVLTRLKRRIK